MNQTLKLLDDIERWVEQDAKLRGGLPIFPIPLLVRLNALKHEMQKAEQCA